MAEFEYLAIDSHGRQKSGRVSAAAEAQARAQLQGKQLYPVRLAPASDGRREARDTDASASRKSGIRLLRPKRLGHKQLALFTRQLSSLVQVSPLDETLQTISRQSEKEHVRQIVQSVHMGVVEGQRLSEAMRRQPASFPPLYTAMVAAGETSGSLAEILDRLAMLMERQAEIRGKLFSALSYPIVLSLVAILVVAGLMISVVPRVVEQFDGVNQQLPWITRAVMGISAFLASWWWAIALLIAALAGLAMMALRQEDIRLKVDRLVLRLPLLGRLIRDLNAARMARTLATMVSSRLPLLEGLKLTRNIVANRVLRAANDSMVEQVRQGGSLSGAMRNAAVFPPLLVYLTASGESAGQLDVMLLRAAEYLEREFDNFTSAALSMLEPLIIVVMGGIVALIILSILLPILQLQNLAGL